MFKDFEAFGIDVVNQENNEVDYKVMEKLIKIMVEEAKPEMTTDEKAFFCYEFKNSPARVGIRLDKTSESLQYEDCTTYLETDDLIDANIFDKLDNDKVVLEVNGLKTQVFMDMKDKKVGDNVRINLSLFPLKIDIFNNEDEYNKYKIKDENGKKNLFNINVGEVLPVMMWMRNNSQYEYMSINDPMFDVYDDAFTIASGKITYAETVKNDMVINSRQVQISQFDYYKINTKYGDIATAIPDKLYNEALQGKDVSLSEDSILKLYGYIVANIVDEF